MTRILTAFLLAIAFYSCDSITGSGRVISEERKVGRFEVIKVSGSLDVEISNGDQPKITVEADDNIVPLIITSVRDGILVIKLSKGHSYRNFEAKIYVTAPVIAGFSIEGLGTISSSGTIKDDQQIDIKIGGSGDISATVDAPVINAEIGGSGTIKLKGRTKDFTSSIKGSGDILCGELLSENATVKISGSGTAHVYSSIELVSKVTGSGDVYYSGSPTRISGPVHQER